MRVWDIPVEQLCNKHLIAQHHEIHCIYNIITKGLKGFVNHPEIKRWEGRIASIEGIHNETVVEMNSRGIKHNTPIDLGYYWWFKPEPWQPIEKQKEILKAKGCSCKV